MAADLSFAVGGMTCASCVRVVEQEISQIPGIAYVSVNLADGKAYAVTDGGPGWEEVAAAVRRVGYQALEAVPTDDEVDTAFKAAGHRVLTAWAMALPAMALMILHMGGFYSIWFPVGEALVGLAVLLWPGRQILQGAWTALTHRHANMDVLVSLGTLAAWTTALLAILGLPVRSFGGLASMLPAFHLTGRLLEERLRRRAGADLRALKSTGGGMVQTVQSEGILELPVEAIKEGMTIRVRTGERIPLDGRVLTGRGAVGEAMITGEPLPALKTIGDEVIGGTVLESGILEVEVTRTGEDAFFARMITLMEQAQGVNIPLQALADRVAGIFVPVVLGLSLAVFAAWAVFHPYLMPFLERAAAVMPWIPVESGSWTTGVFAMVSMLVVACPCALGLATPMAVSVGSGLAARRGLLIKGGEVLQNSGKLDVLVFDKTGTLTLGRPAVVGSDLGPRDVQAAAALEAFSLHPLAKAIVDWAAGEGLAEELPVVAEVEETPGLGISGKVNGVAYSVGRAPEEIRAKTADSGTVVAVRREGIVAGCITLNDPVKEEAGTAIRALLARNVRPVMATGDSRSTALAVAAAVGILPEDVHAALQPEEKLRIVQRFQRQKLHTGMIGDGINDAAALKAADIGFALAQGTDLSMEAGDVVITRGGLERIVEALELSGLMMRKIRGNLVWAFIYNLLALPAAAMGFVHPLMAEAAMSLSSVGVILNSVAIKRWPYRRRNR